MDKELEARFDKIDGKMDKQHEDLVAVVGSIKEVCSSCQVRIRMHDGRLAALDDLRDGAVPKLQQGMASLKTKVAIYAGIASAVATAVVFTVIQAVKSFFIK